MAYEIKRFPYSGTVDADGHVLEPGDLWENYLEDRYKARALRIKVDAEGYEYLEIDQRPSQRTVAVRSESSARWATKICGRGPIVVTPTTCRSVRRTPTNACELLKQENLECALLYPTIGLLWEVELEDPELSLAYARAYNRWIADFCRESSGRLVPIAQLTLLDPEGSAAELERAVKDGCKGAWVNPFNHHRVIHGDAKHDVLFAKCCELDVPLAIHPTFTPHARGGGHFRLAVPGPRVGRSDLVARHRATGADLVLLARHARSVSAVCGSGCSKRVRAGSARCSIGWTRSASR